MENNKTNKIKIATLFNMVKTKSSNETEKYIYDNKINPNDKNEHKRISLLTVANSGMMNANTYKKSKENALFIINNINDPFYKNYRESFDIFETYLLNQYNNPKEDFLEYAIETKIIEKYKNNIKQIQIDFLDTVYNIIKSDPKTSSIIEKSVLVFFNRNKEYGNNLFLQLSPKRLEQLKKLSENDDNDNNDNDNDDEYTYKPINEKIFKLTPSEKLINLIYYYTDNYKNNSLLTFVLKFFDKDGISKMDFDPVLFAPLIYIASFNNKHEELLYNIFNNLDYTKHPLIIKNLDVKTQKKLDRVKNNHPKIYSAINNYFLKSNLHIASKSKPYKTEYNNLRKTRL